MAEVQLVQPNIPAQGVVGITAPVAAKLLEMLKLKQSLGVLQ